MTQLFNSSLSVRASKWLLSSNQWWRWPLFTIKHCLNRLNGYLCKQCLKVVIIFELVVELRIMYKSRLMDDRHCYGSIKSSWPIGHVHIYIFIYVYVYVYVCIYIYIYTMAYIFHLNFKSISTCTVSTSSSTKCL